MTDEIIAFKGEAMLLNWNESKQGRTVVFQLDEEAEQHPFKQFTTKKGKRAGQRFMAVFVEIGDDEQPIVQEKKGGPLSHSAAQLCGVEKFQDFLREKYSKNWDYFLFQHVGVVVLPEETAEIAASVLRQVCGIESRADLDHSADAAKRFHALMREYREWSAK